MWAYFNHLDISTKSIIPQHWNVHHLWLLSNLLWSFKHLGNILFEGVNYKQTDAEHCHCGLLLIAYDVVTLLHLHCWYIHPVTYLKCEMWPLYSFLEKEVTVAWSSGNSDNYLFLAEDNVGCNANAMVIMVVYGQKWNSGHCQVHAECIFEHKEVWFYNFKCALYEMPFDGTIVDLSCNMHHKWCRMICASFCNWSLYFHWQLLYMQKCELCAKSVKNVFVHLFSHSGECAKSVKNLIVHLFSLVTFTDSRWRLPIPTTSLANLRIGASLAVHNQTRVHKPTILMTNCFMCKALQWVNKQTVFIGDSLGVPN